MKKLFLFIILCAACALVAVYVENKPKMLTQPDGSKVAAFVSGDEYENRVHDAKGYTIVQDPQTGYYVYAVPDGKSIKPSLYRVGSLDPASLRISTNMKVYDPGAKARFDQMQLSYSENRMNPSGTYNSLTLFVGFSGPGEAVFNPANTFSHFDDLFNAEDTVSLVDYYQEVSAGVLTLNTLFYPAPDADGQVIACVFPQPRAYFSRYNAETNAIGYVDDIILGARHREIYAWAVDILETLVPPGLNIDGDNNGFVDGITLVFWGEPDSGLWPSVKGVSNESLHGKQVNSIIFNCENWMNDAYVVIHEMGHQLGAPDFYHNSNSGMGHPPWVNIAPVDQWDMMSGNRGHWLTHNKWKYGHWFAEIPVITPTATPTTYTLNAIDTSPYSCYKIPSNVPGQYYMAEYRRKTSRYESQIPGSGLIVYRVMENKVGNAGGPPDEIYIYRPGGTLFENGQPYNAHMSAQTGRIDLINGGTQSPWLYADTLSVLPGSIKITNVGASGGETITFELSADYSNYTKVWTAAIDTNWHNPGNWTDNQLPTLEDDVIIDQYLPSPSIYSASAYCRNLTIAGNAQLYLETSNLFVYEDLNIHGKLRMLSANSVLMVARDIIWQNGSTALINNAGAQIFCKRRMTFNENSNVQLTQGTITFFSGAHNPTVDYDSYIINNSATTQLGNVISDKETIYSLVISGLSTQAFTINGDLKCYQNRRIRSYFDGEVNLKGNLISENTNSPGIYWVDGTLKLIGTNQSIKIPHSLGYLHSLWAANSGTVSSPHALWLKGNLQVDGTAEIVMNSNNLTVDGLTDFNGKLVMNHADGKLTIKGSLNWNSGATLEINSDAAEIFCKGSMTFESGSEFIMNRGSVEFYGDNDRIIVNHSFNTKFHHLRINKSGGAALAISASSTRDIYITGDFTNNQNSIFRCCYTGYVYVKGNFISQNSNSAGIAWEAGTMVFYGSNSNLALAHSGDFLYSFRSNPTSNAYLLSSVTFKGDFSVTSGSFYAAGNTISVGGNWTIQNGATFVKGTSTVVFNGAGTQTLSSTMFNVLRVNKVGGGTDNKLVIPIGKIVSAVSYKYDAGTIAVTGGTFTAADLADSNIKGNYVISSGSINFTQDSQNFVDWDANLTISGGRINIQGGYNSPVDWAHSRDVSITMSGGELDFNSHAIGLTNTGHALTLAISGGTIRTEGSFVNSRTGASFIGGTIMLEGSGDTTISSPGGGSFYDVKISKSAYRSDEDRDRSNKITIDQNITVSGDLTVWNGTLALNAVTLNVGRDLVVNTVFQMNNTGAVLNIGRDFVCRGNSNVEITRGVINITRNLSQYQNTPLLSSILNTINFVGIGDSNLTILNPSVSLGNIGVNKSSGTVGISTTAAALNILGNMTVSTGNQFMFRTIPTVIAGALNVNGAILLQTGGSVTCDDLNMYGNITVAGALSVQHDFYQAPSTSLNILSSGNFIIDKPYTGNYQSFAGTTILNGGAITITNEGIQFGASSNLTINSGTLKIGWGLRAMVADSFHMSTGAIEFIGTRAASIELAAGNYLNNVIASKTGSGYVMLSSDLLLNDLMINSGSFQLLHHTLNIARNLNIMGGTLDASFADDLINLSGWWNNNRSPLGFTQGLGTVAFVGFNRSIIAQSEQFNNLIVNKTEVYPEGVEVETGATLSANSIDFVDGTIYLQGGSTFSSPASGFTIPMGCALYCDPVTPSTINLNGDWNDQNMAIDANQGFSSGKSVINISGSGDRQFSAFASPLILNAVNVNLSSGTCYLSSSYIQFYGNLNLQSGTLQPNMVATIECYQNLSTAAGTNFSFDMGTVNLKGEMDSTLEITGASNFSNLTINKGQSTAAVALANDWIAPSWCLVDIQKGIFELNGNVFCVNGSLQINAGGTLAVDAGAEMRLGSYANLDVNSGGKLSVLGTAVAPALLSRTEDGYYGLNINSGGSIAAEHAIFEYLNYSGVNIVSGATVDAAHSFNYCTFRNGGESGTLLSLSNEQFLTITGAVFPENTWSGMSNVSKYIDSGSIRFIGESGAFAGASFEGDPYMRINWNNNVPSLATSTSSLSFGNVYIPMTEYRTFTITNSGSGSLTGILSLPDDFTAGIYRAVNSDAKTDEPPRNSSLEFMVLPGSSVEVQIAFMPTQPITYNSTLVITHNASGSPVNISLTGYGIGAQVTVNPTEIIKGIISGGSHTQTLSITDSGNASLSYYATIEYPTRDRAVILSESFESTTFPPAGWGTSAVATVGTAGVWARSNGAVHPSGVAAQDGGYLAYFNSWNCSAGNQTRLQTGYLNFSAYSSISLSFWMYHDSAYSAKNDRIQVQAMNNQQWVNVGEAISRAQAPYNEWRKHTISLSAYGNMNYINIGLLGISEYGSDLNIDNVSITGSNPPTGWVFFNGQMGSVSNVLAPGATDMPSVNIYTSGMDAGIYQAEIHIASNDPLTPDKVVPIEISVGSPGLSVSPAALAFGNQLVNSSATQNFSIEATGSLHLSGTITAPAGYSIQAATRGASLSGLKESASNRWASSVVYLLAPGETKTYQVQFSPTAIQAYNGNISITSDLLATQTILLSGAGANVPALQTLAATAITSSSATLNAQISSSGGLAIYGRGFKYGTDPDPINNGNDYFVVGTNNSYSAYPTELESGQQIYFCAFAYNEMGRAYGEVLSFVTLNPQLIVTPLAQIDFGSVVINSTSAAHSFTVSGSDLTGTVGLNATEGFRISLVSGTRAQRATTDQISLSPVAGVLAETTIYVFFEPTIVQPYSGTVTIVTANVPDIEITLSGTGITIPTLTAIEATEITLSTASSGGNISDDGGSPITVRGVCWSELPDPTLADEHSSDGTGSGIFASSLSDLLPGTQYFISAYATNLTGTVYSESVTFLTLEEPVVSGSQTELSFGSIEAGEISTPQSFIVAGSGLSTDLIVSAPTGFQISLDGRDRQRDYGSEISITPSSGSVFETILVRFAPLNGGEYSANIVISSTGATDATVLVSGNSPLALAAPSNLRISMAAGAAVLNWDAVPNAGFYKVYRSLNPYAADWGTPVATPTNPTWTDIAVAAKYFYRVTASPSFAKETSK